MENLFFQMEDYKEKADWSNESKEEFAKIRRGLLNCINGSQRLPETLCYKNTPINAIPAGELMAKLIDNR